MMLKYLNLRNTTYRDSDDPLPQPLLRTSVDLQHASARLTEVPVDGIVRDASNDEVGEDRLKEHRTQFQRQNRRVTCHKSRVRLSVLPG